MEEAIVGKLRALLQNGITTEPQLVYLLVEIRKLYERSNTTLPPYLEMFCDWVVHAKLDRAKWAGMARELKDRRIAQEEFQRGLALVLANQGMPEPPNWLQVLQLLAAVLEDCPLEFREVGPKIELTVAPGHGGGWSVAFKTEQAPAQQRRHHCPPASPVR